MQKYLSVKNAIEEMFILDLELSLIIKEIKNRIKNNNARIKCYSKNNLEQLQRYKTSYMLQ